MTFSRLCVYLTLFAATAWLPAQRPTYRASTAAVLVDVSVQDRGKPVTGLTPADFVVLDNGEAQAITELSVAAVPLEVTLLIDASESLDLYLDYRNREGPRVRPRIADGLPTVERVLRPTDRLRVVRFASGVSTVRADADLLPGSAVYERRTSLFDAVTVALMERRDPARRRIVIVVTDGIDTSSVVPFELRGFVLDRADGVVHLVSTATAIRPVFFPMATFEPYSWILRDMADRTGGRYFKVGPSQDYASMLRTAIDEFRSRYVLGFTPAAAERAAWHDLRVSVRGRNYDVRHRRGYWGGGT